MKNKKGLTLIELLAVIAIIAILFVLLIPQINSAIDKSRISGVQTDFRSYETALRSFAFENNSFPKNEDELNKILDSKLRFDNNLSFKNDPWGNPYQLLITTENLAIASKNSVDTFLLVVNNEGQLNTSFENDSVSIIGDYISYPSSNSAFGEEKEDSTFYFIEHIDFITIKGYKGSSSDVTIPEQINGKNVKAIADYAFHPKNSANHPTSSTNTGSGVSLTSVSFPNTLEVIGSNVFNDSFITSLNLPNKLRIIGDTTFSHNAISSVVFNSDIKEIGDNPFVGNNVTSFITNTPQSVFKIGSDLSSLYSLDDKNIIHGNALTLLSDDFLNVEVIEPYAFFGQNIQTVVLHDNIRHVKYRAFTSNVITSLTIGKNVQSIEEKVFYTNNAQEIIIINNSSISNNYLSEFVFNNLNLNFSN